MKLILCTGNVMSAGPSVIRKSGAGRSNIELVNSLRHNFVSAQEDYASGENGDAASTPAEHARTPVHLWTEQKNDTLYIPRTDTENTGLRDDAEQYEITVKLFLLPGTSLAERLQNVREALALITKELGTSSVDLLVVSFPGLSFEGTCEMKADRLNAQQGNLDEEVETWRMVEDLQRQGAVRRLGVAEFGSEKLGAFLKRVTVSPAVDQINLKDCCKVPVPLKKIAEANGIELNVHSDCTDILPSGTLRELLSWGSKGAGVLADTPDGQNGLQGEILPQWVARYTAFVKDRGVIENKGYFAGAELQES